MKVIVVASQKGGAGKTTISSHLGVELTQRGHTVVLIDTDRQGTLTKWWNRRQAEQPVLVATQFDQLPEVLDAIRESGADFVIIDTPPQVSQPVREVVKFADLVLVPSKPGPNDLDAINDTITIVEEEGKPMMFVVNEAKLRTKLTADTLMALSHHGKIAGILNDLTVFAESMIDGRTAGEFRPTCDAAVQVRKLCDSTLKEVA